MRVAITGGTGTLGRALIARLLQDGHERVVSLARNVERTKQLERDFPHKALRTFIGDIRDRDRLLQAFWDIEVVIHAAAIKQVDGEPGEAVKTNILGTENVIWAAERAGVGKLLFISSDKAVHATNFYGTTKRASEEESVHSNSYTFPHGLAISCTRYGNVLGSSGSVTEVWAKLDPAEPIPITSAQMTRFVITKDQAVQFVLDSIDRMEGGEIFIPILPSMRILDLALALYPGRNAKFIGLRPYGEKIHEILVSDDERYRLCYADPGTVVVLPRSRSWSDKPYNYFAPVPPDRLGMFNSETAERLTVQELEELCGRSL